MQAPPANYDINRSGPALIYANASWCGHCKTSRPVMTSTAEVLKEGGIPVYDVEEGRHPQLIKRWGVQSFPTILMTNGRGGIFKYEGSRTVDALVTWVCLNGDGKAGFCRKVRVPS